MAKKQTELKQVGKFSAIGAINTLIDFALLNFANIVLGFPRIPSNVFSTTVAMSFSFLANKKLVFRSKGRDYLRQAGLFLAITATGLYVLQNSVIYFLTNIWLTPLEFGIDVVGFLGLGNVFSSEFIYTNGAKAAATALSLVWNYFWYRNVVFKDDKTSK